MPRFVWLAFRRAAVGLLALGLFVVAMQAQADTLLRLTFTTGGDNLRGGNVSGSGNNVYVRFLDASGYERQALRNGNKSATWNNGSVNEVAMLDIGSVAQFASVEISVSDRLRNDIFEEVDHWNLEALRITVEVDGVQRTLLDLRGTPLYRFTAGGPPQRFALTPVEDRCSADIECSDGRYCNGEERCVLNRDGNPAVLRTCAPPIAPVACSAGLVCDEASDRCGTVVVDADADGAPSMYDCDDNDRRRYPGGSEVCDHDGVDEDCDLATAGVMDADGDGHNSSRCFNWGPPRR